MGYLGDYMVRVTIWKLNMNYLPVPFRPVRQLSEYKGKGASASRELILVIRYLNIFLASFGCYEN